MIKFLDFFFAYDGNRPYASVVGSFSINQNLYDLHWKWRNFSENILK